MSFVVPNTLKGFGVTLKQIFKKPITQQYPEYKRPVYPRYRGRHRLNVHENGLEKCVGCSLCAAACPADCIRVVAAENTPDEPRLGRRALRAHLRDQHVAAASSAATASSPARSTRSRSATTSRSPSTTATT